MSNGFPWCIASVPIPSWAKTVFPDLPEDEQKFLTMHIGVVLAQS